MSDIQVDHQYVLELWRQPQAGAAADGDGLLSTTPVVPDWTPAVQWARLTAARKQRAGGLLLDGGRAVVEPAWDSAQGPPYVERLRVTFSDGSGSSCCDIPKSYFRGLAKAASTKLVEAGTLADGDVFRYQLCAYPAAEHGPGAAPPGDGLAVEPVARALPVSERALDSFHRRSASHGDRGGESGVHIPVFLPRRLLEETEAILQRAGPVETGGILIGRLHRDPAPELFLEITAQIPARFAEQELTRLTFTAETWSDAEAAIRLRGCGELYLGWWHSHPARAWCQNCPEEKRARCKLTGAFFSDHDALFHRAVFPQAYSVALVISDSYAEGTNWSLFGWHAGTLSKRNFHVMDPAASSHRALAAGPGQRGG